MPMIRITPDRDRPNGWKVLELAGIPAYVEPSFFILLLVYFALGASRDRLNVSQTGIFCFAVFISLLVHEYGHALMAKVLGCSRLRIAIWSGGGLAYHSPTTRPNSMMILAAGPG
ncbi:hypothetical protein HY256_07495, partial [Candidatus Sumerlaeota bacterium]|nr:hypothetical protein [Candidatus Sumerlaeota bacterium]